MSVLTAQTYLRLQQCKSLNIEEFCQNWIPKLYGFQPDEYGYRKACIAELARLMDGAITAKGIDKNWKWNDGKEEYPSYVKPILSFAHQRYVIMEALGVLPKYTIDD